MILASYLLLSMVKRPPKKHIDNRLQRRLKLYGIISFILLCVVGFDILTSTMNILQAVLGVALGVGVGVVSARMFHISWDQNAGKTVARLDLFGGIILMCYIVFAFFRNQLLGEFVHGAALGGVSMAVVTGIMVGRILGMRGKILKVLKEQQLI